MLDPQKGIVGISIGNEKIFLTQLKRRAGKLEIDKLINVGLAVGIIQNGYILDMENFASTLKKLFVDNNIKARQVFVSIADVDVIMRLIEIPSMPKAKMKEALKVEVDKVMLSAEEAIIDYYPLNKGQVFLIAIKKDIVTKLLSAMGKAGLNLIGVDIVPLAAWRALSQGNVDLSSNKAIMFILVGNERADIIVIKQGTPLYSRNIEMVDVSELTKEINITTTYWEEQFPDTPLEKTIVLTDILNNKDFLFKSIQELGAIEQVRPLGIATGDFSLSQTASIGLAVRGCNENFSFDINLLPPEKFKRMKFEKKFLTWLGLISGILLVFFIMSFIFSLIINSYEKRLIPIKKQLVISQDLISQTEKVRTKRSDILSILTQKKDFIAQAELTPWPEILMDIRDYIPNQVQLTGITSEKGNTLILKGESFSQDAVYKYVNLLEFSNYFYDPKLAVMQSEEEGDRLIFKFNIICQLMIEDKRKE